MEPVVLDGSEGEGGGQILRSSLALSALTGKPLALEKIRARRSKPGLAKQHLACVRAAAALVEAEVTGDELRSQSLRFTPTRAPRAGRYEFDIGTAGSTGLVLQTVLWPLALADGDSEVVVRGGTHNPMSPPTDFLATTFAPIIARSGVELAIDLERHGFYPAGGGRIRARIAGRSGRAPEPFELLERGERRAVRARVLLADLPAHIGQREARALARALDDLDASDVEIDALDRCGPGNAIVIELVHQHITEVVTGFGEKRVRAEVVASRAANEARAYLAADAPVGEHLADQLIIPLALAGGGSIRVTEPSLHTRTNIDVVSRFVDTAIELTRDGDSHRITAHAGGAIG